MIFDGCKYGSWNSSPLRIVDKKISLLRNLPFRNNSVHFCSKPYTAETYMQALQRIAMTAASNLNWFLTFFLESLKGLDVVGLLPIYRRQLEYH
jgi:hypothetical protein